jgi:hypothetical protein
VRQGLLCVYSMTVPRGLFGADYSEKTACTSAGFRFDSYFPDEATVEECAFRLHNPGSEFARDVFKCLLAIDDECAVKKVSLNGEPGAIARLNAQGPQAIVMFARTCLQSAGQMTCET